jgi:protein gp37
VPTKIEWTDESWNPVTGCVKISPGCKHCYAKTFAERFRGVVMPNGQPHVYHAGFDVQLRPDRLSHPLRWPTPRMVFVTSAQPWLAEAQNIWLGVSVENRKHGLPRVGFLRQADAAVKFLSIEPLLEDLGTVELSGIDWVIVGGESGPRARPMHGDWVRSVREQCLAAGIPFFFKQWGGFNKKRNGRELDGRTWDDLPGQCVPGGLSHVATRDVPRGGLRKKEAQRRLPGARR